jgi:hypothetical protein
MLTRWRGQIRETVEELKRRESDEAVSTRPRGLRERPGLMQCCTLSSGVVGH